MPLGFPGHAIYPTLRTSTVNKIPVVTFSLVNLGGASFENHDRDDSDRLYQRIINIPVEYIKSEEGYKTFQKFLIDLIKIDSGEKYDGRSDIYYAKLTTFEDLLKAKYPGDFVDNPTSLQGEDRARFYQIVGNCVLKNYPLSNGDLADSIKHLERQYAKARLQDTLNTEQCFKENDARRNKETLYAFLSQAKESRLIAMQRYMATDPTGTSAKEIDGSVLFQLLRQKDIAMLMLLLEHGANANSINDRHESLIQIATRMQLTPVVQTLLAHQAKPNIQDVEGKTAMHEAAQSCSVELMKMLKEAGGDSTIKDNDGKTAAQIFVEKAAALQQFMNS